MRAFDWDAGTRLRRGASGTTSFFPDAWNYKKTDPSSRKIQNAWGMAIDLN